MKKCTVGIDAHKESNVLALAFSDMKPSTIHGKVSADLNRTVDAIRKIQKKHDLEKEDLQICYEAGPTGFVLARRLIQLGYDCQVIAPSLIPTKPGDKKKTDKRDARKLAEVHRSGLLTALHIPDVDDEVVRDVCRGRTDSVNDLKSSKKQLLSFLLRNGYRYPEKARWTEAHMRYLRELVMAHPTQKILLEEYIRRIDNAEEQIKRLEDKIREITRRTRGVSLQWVIGDLKRYMPGWQNYYRIGLSKKLIQELNRWIIRRLRAFLWEQWKLPRTKVKNLKKLGLDHDSAVKLGNTRKGPWRVSDYQSMNYALPAKWFVKHYGLIRLR